MKTVSMGMTTPDVLIDNDTESAITVTISEANNGTDEHR